MNAHQRFSVFAGDERVAGGDLAEVAQHVKALMAAREDRAVLVFADESGRQLDVDLRGNVDHLLRQAPDPAAATPASGSSPRDRHHPQRSVVGGEVTLLPRHWDWLNMQPGGASVALRKLVEIARLENKEQDRMRLAREATYRFMAALAGDRPGFEEATRALFAGNHAAFTANTRDWPGDILAFANQLAAQAFPPAESAPDPGSTNRKRRKP